MYTKNDINIKKRHRAIEKARENLLAALVKAMVKEIKVWHEPSKCGQARARAREGADAGSEAHVF